MVDKKYLHILLFQNTVCLQKFDILLKAIILKTTESSSMKLNSLRVEHHTFILRPIS